MRFKLSGVETFIDDMDVQIMYIVQKQTNHISCLFSTSLWSQVTSAGCRRLNKIYKKKLTID